MILAAFSDSGLYTWVILPILIMLARICDVSIGTIKLIFVARGDKVVDSKSSRMDHMNSSLISVS